MPVGHNCSFSGIVDARTFTAFGIVIQSAQIRGSGPFYRLSADSRTTSENGAVLDVNLSLQDMVSLNTIAGLGTEVGGDHIITCIFLSRA